MTRLSQAPTWLAEEPDHSFTLNMVFLRGWPSLAEFLLLPKPWTLGRAARTLERVLCLGSVFACAVFDGLPMLSFWLVVLFKVGAVLVGLLTQGALKFTEYLLQGAERVMLDR